MSWLLVCGVAVVVLVLASLDFRYFFSSAYAVLGSREGSARLFDLSEYASRCHLADIDWMVHMNNSRILRVADFARIKFYTETGVWRVIKALGGSIVTAGSTIRCGAKFLRAGARGACWL